MLIQIPNPVQAGESDSPQQKQASLWAPAGWLRIQLSSDTVYKEIVSDSTGQGFCSMRLYSLRWLSRAVSNPGYLLWFQWSFLKLQTPVTSPGC